MDKKIIKKTVRNLIKGEDYRRVIVDNINEHFLQETIDFFKQIVDAKIKNKNITTDWYQQELLNDGLSKEEIAMNAGLNMKTITNIHNSGTKKIVIEASRAHYKSLYESIQELTAEESEVNLNLTIKLGKVSVDLNLSESLIVINTLAVKRSAIRGGAWSTIGKIIEAPLLLSLCHLYGVAEDNYRLKTVSGELSDRDATQDVFREIDFYFTSNGTQHNCEIKLMGKGNPESADAVIARDSKVFVADKLSDLNKRQLDQRGTYWVELRGGKALEHFKRVLEKLDIPHQELPQNVPKALTQILNKILK